MNILTLLDSKINVFFLIRTVCDDVKDVWRRAMGSELVLKKREDGAGIVDAQ